MPVSPPPSTQHTCVTELRLVADQCRWRGLNKCAVWLTEQQLGLSPAAAKSVVSHVVWSETPPAGRDSRPLWGVAQGEGARFLLAKTMFDRGEYLRCWNLLKGCVGARPRFLHYYARYMAGEERRQHQVLGGSGGEFSNPYLTELHSALRPLDLSNDPYMLWLRGVVHRCLKHIPEAKADFVRSIELQQSFWASWQELIALQDLTDALQLVPGDWVGTLAHAILLTQQHMWERAVGLLIGMGSLFGRCPAVLQQVACVRRHLRQWDRAKEAFEYLLELHPYRFEGIVDFSNVLFITRKKNFADLCQLAHRAFTVAKYRPETCMLLGDYHSACGRHEKAVKYFQRALSLDPHGCSEAHIMLGHEGVELKLTGPALAAYRSAVDTPTPSETTSQMAMKRISSGWHALGMVYELLGNPCIALLHYTKAAQLLESPIDLQPYFGGMAASFEEMGLLDDAIQCYHRKGGGADTVLQLARLMKAKNNLDRAAVFFHQYLLQTEVATSQPERLSDAQQEALLVVAQHSKTKAEELLQENPEGNADQASDLLQRSLWAAEVGLRFPSVETGGGICGGTASGNREMGGSQQAVSVLHDLQGEVVALIKAHSLRIPIPPECFPVPAVFPQTQSVLFDSPSPLNPLSPSSEATRHSSARSLVKLFG
eukprot:Sspe_Gene.8872::Locus_2987_Transcript_1_3_Confidence_0.500_Length_2119::g.8872::m.8872/K03355/APC8, CDC23; anaphase-promoting complex subunit 8